MQVATLVSVLLLNFANPDLCADVYLDEIGQPYADSHGRTLPRYCQWTGPDAPVLDSDVCCTIDQDGAHCSLPDDGGRCSLGFKMYCAHGTVFGGGVTCMKPFPSACDQGFCQEGFSYDPEGVEQIICCTDQGCETIETLSIPDCVDAGGQYLWCNNGVSNLDGTTDCLD